MDINLTVKRNTLLLIAREAINKGALLVLLILIGRISGKEALGRYSLAISISTIFFFGTELGLNIIAVREVAKDRLIAGKFLANMGFLRFALGCFTMGLIGAVVFILRAKGEAAAVIYLCAASYFFVNITSLYTSIFRAFEKMELELFVAVIKNLIFFPLAVWILFANLGLIPLFNLFLLSNIIALIITHLIFTNNIAAPQWQLDFGFCKGQLRHTSPVWLIQLLGVAYLKIAPLLLFRLKGEEAVGLYNAGFVVVDGFAILSGCFVASLFPVISRLDKISRADTRREYFKGLRLLLIFSVLTGGLLVLSAPRLLPFIYGNKFVQIVPLFNLLTLAAVLVVIDGLNGFTLIAIGRQRVLPLINAAALIVNIGCNLFLIRQAGYIGSAYSLIISEAVVFVLVFLMIRKFLLAPEAAK